MFYKLTSFITKKPPFCFGEFLCAPITGSIKYNVDTFLKFHA